MSEKIAAALRVLVLSSSTQLETAGLTRGLAGDKVGFMISRLAILTLFALLFVCPTPSLASEVAPRITDREIVERLAKLDARMDALQKRLEEGQAALNKRIDDLRSEMSQRFVIVDRRFDDLRSDMNGRFDTLQWTLGLFITIALIILGFVLRLQWQMSGRQTQTETTLETHKDEIAFLKGLIEKLLPPRGTL